MNKQICLLYNYGQHYREAIFKSLDDALQVDFYFGDKMHDVKKLDYKILKGKVEELKNINILINPFYWQKGAINLVFKPYNNYIILGEYYCLSTWFILLISCFTNKKVYLWTHGWYGNEGFFKRLLKRTFFSLATKIFLYGDYAKQLMIKEGFEDSKLVVIYNSLDYNKQLKIREKMVDKNIYFDHFRNNFPTIIFIGRLTAVKKLDQLIKAHQILNNNDFPVNLVFVGDGEMKEELFKSVDSTLKDKVWFYGPSYDEFENAQLIFNADMCVSPGNVGLTAIHCLMYGTPVLTHSNFASQMPEFECIENLKSGLFFNENDISDICNSIKRMSDINSNRDVVRLDCYKNIDKYYNPNYQVKIISQNLSHD